MSYIDGFVIACPKDNKQKFIDHANMADSVFLEMGALRVVECWGDDVPQGTSTDFYIGGEGGTRRSRSFKLDRMARQANP